MYFLKKDYTLRVPQDEPRFIPGRCAEIVVDSKVVGIFGEVHPAVLESWGCGMPTIAGEIDMDCLL